METYCVVGGSVWVVAVAGRTGGAVLRELDKSHSWCECVCCVS